MAMVPMNMLWKSFGVMPLTLVLSVTGVQVMPPFLVFQTPPPAVAMYETLALFGSAAMAVIRPDAGAGLATRPFVPASSSKGAGPIGNHWSGTFSAMVGPWP